MIKWSDNLIEFDCFQVDLKRRILKRDGVLVHLQPKYFDILVVLLEAKGELVTKDELIEKVWQGTVVEEGGLKRNISELRKALGQTKNGDKIYIVTVSKRGYRFNVNQGESTENINQAQITEPTRGNTIRITTGVLLLILGLFSFSFFNRENLHTQEPLQRQITNKPTETPIKHAAISPNGSLIAYIEKIGEGEKTVVKLLQTGNRETSDIPTLHASEVFRLSWLPDSTTLLVSGKLNQADTTGIWIVPVLAGASPPIKVPVGGLDPGEAAAMDKSHIAYISGNRDEIWLTGVDGESPHLILKGREGDEFNGLAWLAGGQRLVFNKVYLAGTIYGITVDTLDLETGKVSTVIPNNPQLRAGCVTPEGRIFYAVEYAPPHQNDTSLWEMSIDPQSGEITQPGKMLVRSNGSTVHGLSATADGKQIVILKGPYQADVWVGDIDRTTQMLSAARRLTHDDGNDLVTTWTQDSKAVFFHSNRTGDSTLYKQSIDSTQAEKIFCEGGECRGARMSPDGVSLFYIERADGWLGTMTGPVRLKVSSITGENPRLLYSAYALLSMRCARSPSDRCVMSERSILPGQNSELIFRSLTREGVSNTELARMEINLPLGKEYWDLSPDGSKVAVVTGGSPDGVIRLIGFDGSSKDVIVKGRNGFHSMDWAADGSGWYISTRSAKSEDLLYVDLHGNYRVIRESTDGFETWGVPSPDGKHLAVLEWTVSGNIFILDELPEQRSVSQILLVVSVMSVIGGLILLFRRRVAVLQKLPQRSGEEAALVAK
jgi:eukaryotic-like serine/threonine-protein kinase